MGTSLCYLVLSLSFPFERRINRRDFENKILGNKARSPL